MFKKNHSYKIIRNGKAIGCVMASDEKSALHEYRNINLLGNFYKDYRIGRKAVLIAKSIYDTDVLSASRIA